MKVVTRRCHAAISLAPRASVRRDSMERRSAYLTYFKCARETKALCARFLAEEGGGGGGGSLKKREKKHRTKIPDEL